MLKALFPAYALGMVLAYLKIIPDPSKFFFTRDVILKRRKNDFWQFNLVPFSSYFNIGENLPTNLLLIFAHLIAFAVFGVLLAAAFSKLSLKKCLLISLVASVLLEVLQFILAAGVPDIDTVIQHIIGASAGLTTAFFIRKRRLNTSVS